VKNPLEQYNVVWDSPSRDSSGSMPIGNGDIGLNVWAEETGDLVFYIGKTDAWSGNGRLLKLGRVRVGFSPNPFAEGVCFQQTLNLRRGRIDIVAGEATSEVKLCVWVDANQPVVHIEVESEKELDVQVGLEIWRTEIRQIAPGDLDMDAMEDGESFSAFGVTGPEPIYQHPDEVWPARDDRVIWCHRNRYSVYPLTMELQSLESLMDTIPDPLFNRTFGGCIKGNGLRTVDGTTLKSAAPSKRYHISVYLLTEQTASVEEWVESLERTIAHAEMTDLESARATHDDWWHRFWERSWICVAGDDDAALVSQHYHLQRFINACGGRGAYPIKFNGSIFTVDGPEDWRGQQDYFDADYRRWGPCYWFQNTRPIYWPLLACGDFDLMKPFFRLYSDVLPLAQARTPIYYGHQGAFFPETITFWGTYQNEIYGWDRAGKPLGHVENRYLRYYWSGGLELSSIMLDYYAFTQDSDFLSSVLLSLVDSVVTFYDQHYERDERGKVRFFPAQALETWWECVNPLPEIAGLGFVLDKLLALPPEATAAEQRHTWQRLLGELPEIPTRQVDGETVLAPADSFDVLENSENVGLYAVHPYRIYGVGKPGLDMARRTFEKRMFRAMDNESPGYHPDPIQAAFLGLPETARRHVLDYFKYRDPNSRFVAFYAAAADWLPNQQTGNVAMLALQKMVMQTAGKRIILLPAWPKDWDVEFKLHAPYNTLVEGVYREGKLEQLMVIPESRAKDIECPAL
jgi:alpha-L-fucosidase 2